MAACKLFVSQLGIRKGRHDLSRPHSMIERKVVAKLRCAVYGGDFCGKVFKTDGPEQGETSLARSAD